MAGIQEITSKGTVAMKACTSSLSIDTERAPQFIDITDRVWEVVRDAQVQTGFVVVFSRHTTAAIKISENEPLLLHDLCAGKRCSNTKVLKHISNGQPTGYLTPD